MKICIDARFWGSEHSGLGRYTENVVSELISLDKQSTFVILLRSKYASLPFPSHVTSVVCDIPHYSLLEQLTLPGVVESLKPDVFYALHLNVPILLKTPVVVTIHDLIKSHFKGPETTTHNLLLFPFKRLGYNMVIGSIIKKSSAIIVPSNFVKGDLSRTFPSSERRIHVVKEAVAPIFTSKPRKLLSIHDYPSKYILFVGNAYPHKNLNTLISALRHLPKDIKLAVVSKQNTFLRRTLASVSPDLSSRLVLFEGVSDSQLYSLYQRAMVTAIPSLMEGYGLVGIESLSVGTPIVVSDIPVFKEVYGKRALYVDPGSPRELASKVLESIKLPRRKFKNTRTWKDVAGEIKEILDETGTRLRSA